MRISKHAFISLAAGLLLHLTCLGAPDTLPVNGDLAPAYAGQTFDGDEVSPAAYLGKVVIVSFWASWCPYCLKELPILEALQKKAGKERLQVIAVNTEERQIFKKLSRIMKDFNILLSCDKNQIGAKAYGVKGIPHMVIIGKDGRIVQVYRGYDDQSLDAILLDINKALAETVVAAN